MKVILLEDIKSLGRRGEVKNVSNGYARNFLLPKKLVTPATEVAIQNLNSQKEKLDEQLGELKTEIESIEKATTLKPLVFEVKAGEKGEVFSSVGAEDIKAKLVERYPKISSENLKVGADHIRELGRHEVDIELRGDPKSGVAASGKVEGKVTIEVLPQQP